MLAVGILIVNEGNKKVFIHGSAKKGIKVYKNKPKRKRYLQLDPGNSFSVRLSDLKVKHE